ncbi:lipopolysaccharide transport system permease protein [Paraburkholderia fungorum]|nr:lipopolysaccharide transport system permease protein [Paraburkholderia fungorum]
MPLAVLEFKVMKRFSSSPKAIVDSFARNRRLLYDLAKRDAIGRYKGSVFGILWSLLTPLLMLTVYTFVFSEVFKARWGGAGASAGDSKTAFAIVLFAGMIVFNIFGECVSRAPGVVLGHSNYVTKIIFPLELLPVVNLLSALFHACISFAVLLVFELVERGSIPLTVFWLPFVLLPLSLLTLGVTWWLSATGVFVRDIGQTIGIFITALMFLSPVFFSLDSLPPRFRLIAHLNPLAFPIEQARNVLVFGTPIEWTKWLIYVAATSVIAWLGFAWFQRVRKGFADVI